MTRDDRLMRALHTWRDGGIPVVDPAAAAAREERMLEPLRRAIQDAPLEHARARRRRRAVVFAWAAAALIVLGVGVAFVSRIQQPGLRTADQPSLLRTSGPDRAVALRNGSPLFAEPDGRLRLLAGDEVSIPSDGRGELTLPSASRLELAELTWLRITEAGNSEQIRLLRGQIELQVPKLHAPRTLSVTTPDARIVVRGTRFSVTVDYGPSRSQTVTTVTVTEGEVAVLFATGHVVLRPGESWSSSRLSSPASPPVTEPAPSPISPASPRAAPARSSSTDHASLTEQNRIYRAALAARDRGDDRLASTLLSELLERYPGSPLSEAARGERRRALQRLDAPTDAESRR